jgi:hypothetical protein
MLLRNIMAYWSRIHFRAVVASLVFVLMSGAALAGGQCTYTTYKWNVHDRKAVGLHKVVKSYDQLTADEKDSQTGCTVCEEDQVELSLPGLRPFKVCKLLAPRVEKILAELQAKNAPVVDVVGYRVGMTRGNVDAAGNRTGFSNHSYGVALDINTAQNGLYENCYRYNASCRLIKGGRWDPKQPLSLTADSAIVLLFKKNGFKWGGEIAGQQKDFMHFSPTGY